jgi:hypothetical protein
LSKANLTKEEANNLRVRDFKFEYVGKNDRPGCQEIGAFVTRHEWLGKMPMRPTHRFVATYQGKLAGVIVMATPNSFSSLLGHECRHLEKLISRGACISWSPMNLGSALVAFSIRWMVKNTAFRIFTAYSDPEAGELGTIYQACNFTYLGQLYGARSQYFDPLNPDRGWFSDRQFRKASQVKHYARELSIHWEREWWSRDKIHWPRIPSEIATSLKMKARLHLHRCHRRELAPKHKYVYIRGRTRAETLALRQTFRELRPELQGLAYPKLRGAIPDTAAKIKIKKGEKIA